MINLYEIDEIRDAYLKLKQHTYYDSSNTNLPLRKTVSEFENLGSKGRDKVYKEIQTAFSNKSKLDKFLESYLSKINYHVIPKSIKPDESNDETVVTNNRIFEGNHVVDRFNLIIDAPIQIHLISVLWIKMKGADMDAMLSDKCYGNRLILKEDETSVVDGRGCFKPYLRQYQAWRDDGVDKAKANLDAGIDVAFVNIDITEYYYHIKLDWEEIPKSKHPPLNRIHYALKKIHQRYSHILFKDFEKKFDFENRKKESENEITKTILPIGLMSSYVLANYYLLKWDRLVKQKLKPIYYGRYVDDILLVISKPDTDYNGHEEDVPDSIKFVHNNLSKVLIIDQTEPKAPNEKIDYVLKLKGLDELFLQPNKMMLYEFKADQSLSVIEKLKRDLEEKSSEFRFLATDTDGSFDSKAFELLYDNSFGKPKTLKDYKENRYGIAAFLAKRINASLRVDRENIIHESEKILSFFKGLNAVRFYQQWERIFTYLIVNQRKIELLKFYKGVLGEIQKLEVVSDNKSTSKVQKTMFNYLNLSLSLSLSLDPGFFSGYLERQFNYLNNNPEYQIVNYG